MKKRMFYAAKNVGLIFARRCNDARKTRVRVNSRLMENEFEEIITRGMFEGCNVFMV